MTRWTFELGWVWLIGAPALLVLVAVQVRWWHRAGRPARFLAPIILRGLTLLILVVLAARPVAVRSQDDPADERRQVVILLDRSESMSLEEVGQRRYDQAVAFTRNELLPALQSLQLEAKAYLFAEDAEESDGPRIAQAEPTGKRTNLARGIVRGLVEQERLPMALIALTDGAANESSDNSRAVTALLDRRVPFVGIGFGSEALARTLTLEQVEAPPTAPPQQQFAITAHLRATGAGTIPPFSLALYRDGRLLQTKAVAAASGSRSWLESFPVSEKAEGLYTYSVQLLPPQDPHLRCPNGQTSASVRITQEKHVRILFVQGALTWDYKFIRLALENDPGLKLVGMSRTSSQSVFYQNVENSAEMGGGFPNQIEALAPFNVVVLSNLKPIDLSSQQQEVLSKFCGELGGGVLLIGGPTTFDGSWRDSKLEALLPVRFAPQPAAPDSRPFQLLLTPAAREHRVFQIADGAENRAAWSRLPTFTHFALVESVKPGAQVWAEHPTAAGRDGRRVLMAVQRYGAGLSAVIAMQNFWRWRLAKESDVRHFDRFWRQLLRHLGESGRQAVVLRLADQVLRPGADVVVLVEEQPSPERTSATPRSYRVSATDPDGKTIAEHRVELVPGRAVEVRFRASRSGMHAVSVRDSSQAVLATRSVDIRDESVELLRAARDLETLRQWAKLSGGVAVKAEECGDIRQRLADLQSRLDDAPRQDPRRQPIGTGPLSFAFLLALLCGEWIVRKRLALD